MRCACVALLRGRCRIRAGARRAGLPVPGIGYCETVGRYPPFFTVLCVGAAYIVNLCCGCPVGVLCPCCLWCCAPVGYAGISM